MEAVGILELNLRVNIITTMVKSIEKESYRKRELSKK